MHFQGSFRHCSDAPEQPGQHEESSPRLHCGHCWPGLILQHAPGPSSFRQFQAPFGCLPG
eukprot:12127593-Alexandrium_andersonii.AAC.1